jgi:hypothetical protein
MTTDLEGLEEQVEKLKNAVRTLTASDHPPQERLDRALSYFVRTFREPPSGDALPHFTAVYTAIGNPPIGTTLHVRYEHLTDAERQAIETALVELQRIMAGRYEAARLSAGSAPPPAEESAIPEGRLESLVLSGGARRDQ